MSAGPEDGRLARGRARREALIAATLRVVERDGVAGVTHRRVAQEAGVAASAATYYFRTIDELLVAALTAATERYVLELEEAIVSEGSEIAGLARSIADDAVHRRGLAIAAFELSLLAARRPSLRPAAQLWTEAVLVVARRTTSNPVAVRALAAAVDGLCLQVLTADVAPEVGEIVAILEHALGSR